MMAHSMVCRLLAAAGILALAGCAQESGSHPSYIGLSGLTAGEPGLGASPYQDSETAEALRHVQSNKVLSAMAFQKVTGQAVDPDSLTGRSE
jgi:hypothetical protein